MKSVVIGLAFLATLSFPGQAQVLATVGSSKITMDEFKTKYGQIKRQVPNPPTPEQYLEDLVRFEVGVQEAEKAKLQNDPIVKERFNQVLYNSLLERQLGKKVEGIKITENDMKAFYKNNPELRIAHILIDLKASAKPEERAITQKRALEILDEVKKSKRPFEEMVKLYSDDATSKEMGGDIGYQSRVTLLPSIYDAAVNMKVSEVKGLLETRFGFHIIKLVDRRSYDLADKRQIRAALFDSKRADMFNDYFAKVKKAYKIEVSRDALKALKE
jgi:parvulin-like peptidyl-prolyl isomerase